MGTANYMYIRYGVLVQVPNCHFFFMSYINSIYTVCHVDHYVKVSPSSNKILAHHSK